MHWVEEESPDEFIVPDDIIDVAFSIECKTLPVDHADSLAREIVTLLPWMAAEPRSGIHAIHGAESGNGWERPEKLDESIYLSRRTKLMLRVPRERLNDLQALSGQTLHIQGSDLKIRDSKVRLLSKTETLYARHVVASEENMPEGDFLKEVISELKALDLRFKKVLCGREHTVNLGGKPRTTRSLMVADLPFSDAVRLQEYGIGDYRKQGCGLFIPHKSV